MMERRGLVLLMSTQEQRSCTPVLRRRRLDQQRMLGIQQEDTLVAFRGLRDRRGHRRCALDIRVDVAIRDACEGALPPSGRDDACGGAQGATTCPNAVIFVSEHAILANFGNTYTYFPPALQTVEFLLLDSLVLFLRAWPEPSARRLAHPCVCLTLHHLAFGQSCRLRQGRQC